MLEQQLAQATEERRLNAETIAGTGESLEAIINRLALCEESLASLIPAFVAGKPPDESQQQQQQSEEEAAAVRIQARRRGMNARRSLHASASGRQPNDGVSASEEAFEEGRINAATKIQAMQRGRAVRRNAGGGGEAAATTPAGVDESDIPEDCEDGRPGSRDLGADVLNFNDDSTGIGDIAQPPIEEAAPGAADPVEYQPRSPSPEPLVDEMAAGILADDEAAAKTAAIERLRSKLEPVLVDKDLAWQDVAPALEFYGIAELTEGFDHPEVLMTSLTSAAGPVGKAMAVAKLRPQMEPRLWKAGLKWEDVVPALERRDIEELKDADDDMDGLVSSLLLPGHQDNDLG